MKAATDPTGCWPGGWPNVTLPPTFPVRLFTTFVALDSTATLCCGMPRLVVHLYLIPSGPLAVIVQLVPPPVPT
jgi:hypothetical protein